MVRQKIYKVLGGSFSILDARGKILAENIDLDTSVKAFFPEAAKNLAIRRLQRELQQKSGQTIVRLRQTTDIRIIPRGKTCEQLALFK